MIGSEYGKEIRQMYGWMGTILRVNLTNGEIIKEPLEEKLAHKYVGGRGFTIKFFNFYRI